MDRIPTRSIGLRDASALHCIECVINRMVFRREKLRHSIPFHTNSVGYEIFHSAFKCRWTHRCARTRAAIKGEKWGCCKRKYHCTKKWFLIAIAQNIDRGKPHAPNGDWHRTEQQPQKINDDAIDSENDFFFFHLKCRYYHAWNLSLIRQ